MYSAGSCVGGTYHKMLKFGHPKRYCSCPKKGTISFYYRVTGPKDADVMVNSVDLDQTAPKQSDLGPHCWLRPACPKS